MSKHSTQKGKKEVTRTHKVVRFFTVFLAVLLGILLVGAGVVAIGVNNLLGSMQDGPITTLSFEERESMIAVMEQEDQATKEELEGLEEVKEEDIEVHQGVEQVQVEPEKGVFNFLLLGLDTKDADYLDNSRSDVNMIVTLDTEKNVIRLTSLMRDILLPIEGHGQNRLNTVNRFLGADAAVEYVEKYTGIPLLGYVKVNFSCVASIVNAIGGVDIELTSAEVDLVNLGVKEHNEIDPYNPDEPMLTGNGGMYHLSGKQAVAYMRIRKLSGGEFGRTARQRKVLNQIMLDMKNIDMGEALNLVTEISQYMKTNLSKTDILKYAMMIFNLRGASVTELNIPVEGTYKGISYKGMSVWQIDFDANAKIIQNFIYGDGSLVPKKDN